MTYDKAACDRYRAAHPERLMLRQKAYRDLHRRALHDLDAKRHARGLAYIDSLKTGGCVDCGNKNLTVLDLDHVRGKRYDVSDLTRYPYATIDVEVAKCEVRCANCHRIVTARRRKAA